MKQVVVFLLFVSLLGATGCQWLKPKDGSDLESGSKSKSTGSIFPARKKGSILAGGVSSEAREIERNLGVD